MSNAPFWREKRLDEMSRDEWESLCDGCGLCCLLKLEDEETGLFALTDVACKLFDGETCRCGDYANRKERVPDCVVLSPENLLTIPWMPESCAYRLLAEGHDLPIWHHLVSGDPEAIHEEGMTARGRTESEELVPDEDLEDRIIGWIARPKSRRRNR